MDKKLAGLNENQRKAVLKTEGALLIIAGAGSGKTKVITHRIAHLIEKGVSPFNILAITFTNKAAKEMKERVEKLIEKGDEVWISTFHSTCVKILRINIEKIGYSSNFNIYDSDDSERVIKSAVKELNLSEEIFNSKKVLNKIGRYKDKLKNPIDVKKIAEHEYEESKYAMIYELYQKKLKSNNALDFDDIIFRTIDLFRMHPDVLERYQNRFKYIMIDEYQDSATRCVMKSYAA